MNLSIDLIVSAQRAGNLAAAAARAGGLSGIDIQYAYNGAYDAAINHERQRLQTTELGKIERSTAKKIKEMNQEKSA